MRAALVLAGMLFVPFHLAAKAVGDSGYDGLLKAVVQDGRVDYRSLKADPKALDAFLEEAAMVRTKEFDAWDGDRRKAFLINVYNAATLKLVVDHYPVKSIKEIGGIFKGPWKLEIVHLFGGLESLDHLENERLRKLGDPRIHFAIVCASKGCPSLRSGAYTADNLDAQLDAAARAFLHEKGKNEVDPASGKVCLSPIFKWFRKDFEAKAGTVAAFITPYLNPAERALLVKAGVQIDYFGYDWSLNERSR